MITFRQFLEEGINDPSIFKAIFLAGGPGSGKSYVAGHTTAGNLGFRVVNSDDMFEFLLKKAGLSLDMASMNPKDFALSQEIRPIAKEKTALKQKLFIAGRLGLIIDGTGHDYPKIAQKKKQLEELGYDTYMIFVNTSLETAQKRNEMRPRKVKEPRLTNSWKEVQANIGKFQNLFKKNFTIVDNNNADEVIFTSVFKEITKFSKRPVKSDMAKKWIKDHSR